MWWIVCNVEITLYKANTSIAWFLYTSIPQVLWFLKTWIAQFLNSWILWFLNTLIPQFISIKGCIFARVWVEPLFPSKAAKVNDKQTAKRVELETKIKQKKKTFPLSSVEIVSTWMKSVSRAVENHLSGEILFLWFSIARDCLHSQLFDDFL